MNCQLCQEKLEDYRERRLSIDMRTKIEAHLKVCAECTENYRILLFAESVINNEKSISPDNYLTDSIMAQIENNNEVGYKTTLPIIRVLKPALIITSMAAAIFAGVLIGNLTDPSGRGMSIPVELALIDDIAIESVDILSNQ